MNGEDVVVGGRYVVGAEPMFYTPWGPKRSNAVPGSVVTVDSLRDDGNYLVLEPYGAILNSECLTPYVEPDAAGDVETALATLKQVGAALGEDNWPDSIVYVYDAVAALRERAEKAEAELERLDDEAAHLLASLANAERLRRSVDEVKAEAEHWRKEHGKALRTIQKVRDALSSNLSEDSDFRIWDAVAALRARAAKAEAEVCRLSDEHQNHNEAWVALSDNYEERCAELDQLRAAPQLPADLPVVESVKPVDFKSDEWSVKFADRGSMSIRSKMLPHQIAACLAVLAAEAAKPDPVEELARALHATDGSWKDWCDESEGIRNQYCDLARAAIAWMENRDA